MKSWMRKASVGIIKVKQESHVISYYQLENLKSKIKENCEKSRLDTEAISQ